MKSNRYLVIVLFILFFIGVFFTYRFVSNRFGSSNDSYESIEVIDNKDDKVDEEVIEEVEEVDPVTDDDEVTDIVVDNSSSNDVNLSDNDYGTGSVFEPVVETGSSVVVPEVVEPVQPEESFEPEVPSEPEEPVQPEQPEEPEQPVEPVQPVEPEIPDIPIIIVPDKPEIINVFDNGLVISEQNNFMQGDFYDNGKYRNTKNYLLLNAYYEVLNVNTNYAINFDDNKNVRIVIKEYNSEFNFIKTIDLGYGDIYIPNVNTKYVLIAMYEFDTSIVENNYESFKDKMGNIYVSIIDDLESIRSNEELLASYVNKGTLSNQSSYRRGYYKSWGGSFILNDNSLCTRNKYKVDVNTKYYININDSRIKISIQEYKEDGSWNSYRDSYFDGDEYIPSPGTSYIAFNVGSSIWGVNIYNLFNLGLTIDIAESYYNTEITKVDINSYDFNNKVNWRAGMYSLLGGFALSDSAIVVNNYLLVDGSTRIVSISNKYLKFNVLEYDEDGNVIKSLTLSSGDKWTPLSNTKYIGLYLTGKNYLLDMYYAYLCSDHNISFDKYVKYEHNTNMNILTASEFVNNMNVGWNLGNSLDSHYGDRNTETGALGQERIWGNPTIEKDLIDFVKACGINTIRIPVTWYYNTYDDENGNLRVREEWLERVADVVDYAIANDMYVILNSHHDQPIIYTGVDDMSVVNNNVVNLWTDIAEYFKTYDEHLIFEAYNEVDNKKMGWTYSEQSGNQLNELNQLFVNTVRNTGGNNYNRILIIPTLFDSAGADVFNHFVIPSDVVSDRLVIEVHEYSPIFDQDIEVLFERLEEYSNRLNTPIIVGEFGSTTSYNPINYRVIHTSNYVARAKNHGIKCIYWDNGSNYAIIDRRDYSNSNMDMINALVNPVAYETNNKVIFDSMSDGLLWKSLNLETGELREDKYWGTIVTNPLDNGILVPDDVDTLSVSLKVNNNAERVKIHYVVFYDENGNMISEDSYSFGYYYKNFIIPNGTKYVRVGINNSYRAIKEVEYDKYFNDGDLKLIVSFSKTQG